MAVKHILSPNLMSESKMTVKNTFKIVMFSFKCFYQQIKTT